MIHILARCGIGDVISHITRINDIKRVYKQDKVKFWLGGYKSIPSLLKQILEAEGIEASIVQGWSEIHQNDMIFKMIKDKNPNDIVIDFNFEKQIFTNQIPDFFKFKMEFPYNFKGSTIQDDYDFFDNDNVIGIQTKTSIGAPDWDHNGKRFWTEDKWNEFIDSAIEKGYSIAIFGAESDKIKHKEHLRIKDFCGKLSVLDNITLIKQCDYFVGTNSWMWEVAAFTGIKTVCLYFTNTFFASLHIPYEVSDINKNLYIESDPEIKIETIFNILSRKQRNDSNFMILDLIEPNEKLEFALINNLLYYTNDFNHIKNFYFPRINIIEDLDESFARDGRHKLSPMFNWVDYPDYQLRLINNNGSSDYYVKGFHIIRRLTKKEYK